MVERAREYIGKRVIYSNMHVEWAEPFDSLQELVGLENGLVLLDEMGAWMNAREYMGVSKQVLAYFMQSRKRKVDLWFSTQAMESVDAHVRRLTSTWWECVRYFGIVCLTGYDAGDLHHPFVRKWKRLSSRVWNLYDTMEIVGCGDGSRDGRMAALRRDQEKCEKEIAASLVRSNGYPTVAAYRWANTDDFKSGATLIRVRKLAE